MTDLAQLTPAQRRVLELLITGMTNKAIGDVLQRSEKTIKAHVAELFKRAGVANRVQLALKYKATQGVDHGNP